VHLQFLCELAPSKTLACGEETYRTIRISRINCLGAGCLSNSALWSEKWRMRSSVMKEALWIRPKDVRGGRGARIVGRIATDNDQLSRDIAFHLERDGVEAALGLVVDAHGAAAISFEGDGAQAAGLWGDHGGHGGCRRERE